MECGILRFFGVHPRQREASNMANQSRASETQSSASSSQNQSSQQPSSATSSGQGQQITRSGQSQQGLSSRRGGFEPFGMMMSPREFFMNPFGAMRRMQEEMDRVFAENALGLRGQGAGGGMGMWSPAVEVSERGGNFIVCAELPGLSENDVRLEMTDNGLVIEGERRMEHEEEQGGIRRSERQYGRFYRTIPLPENVNPEQARADFKNGVLEVTIPLAQSRSRRIPIGSSQQASGKQAQQKTQETTPTSGGKAA
jgi:HSP20 family protein